MYIYTHTTYIHTYRHTHTANTYYKSIHSIHHVCTKLARPFLKMVQPYIARLALLPCHNLKSDSRL